MSLDIYWTTLLVLGPIVAIVAGSEKISSFLSRRRRTKGERGDTAAAPSSTKDDDRKGKGKGEKDNTLLDEDHDDDNTIKKTTHLQKTFLRVYLLVIGSEWLQNPFLYSLFRNEKTLDESTIATLYITTYTSAAVSAPFTGYLADRFGRKRACLVFCAIHSLAATSVCFNPLPVLLVGRVLGGVGLALLWTAFESWVVAEFNTLPVPLTPQQRADEGEVKEREGEKGKGLANLLGVMTTAKCLTAIIAGVLGHCVVRALGSKIHPFLLGVVRFADFYFLLIPLSLRRFPRFLSRVHSSPCPSVTPVYEMWSDS